MALQSGCRRVLHDDIVGL